MIPIPKKYKTDAERQEAKRAAGRRYKKSVKGKIADKRYRQSEKYKAVAKRHYQKNKERINEKK